MKPSPKTIALTREVSPSITQCELTHLERQPIDLERARVQHRAYEACLAALGCEVRRLPPKPTLPDAVFVEDTAVVFDEVAVITRPGAEARRAELPSVAAALEAYRGLVYIEPPGTLDGGDVLCVGKNIFIGLTERSNPAGIEGMRRALEPYGYTVIGVPVDGCLHLKSAVTQVAADSLLINRTWVDTTAFAGLALIDVDPAEAYAANGLLIGGMLIYPQAFPRTRARLEARGVKIMGIDLSELAKAEGAVTCCSLVIR